MKNEIINKIKSGDQKAFYDLYKLYRESFIDWVIFSYNLTPEDSKDIYQETFIILWLNIQENRLTNLTSDIKTYIFSIGKHLAINFIKKNSRTVTLSGVDLINQSHAPFTVTEDREYNRKLLEENLAKLPEKDRKILELYYLEEKDMKTIAQEMGYKNSDVAKKRKYEVFRKLMNLVKNNLKSIAIIF